MIYLSRTYIGIVAEFVCPSITGILWYFVQYDRLCPPCSVETMNDLMNLYIVLSELYTESLNENYIFCVKSMIQVVNKSEEIIKLCSPVFNVRAHTNGLLWQRMVLIEWSLRKDVSCSPGGVSFWERLCTDEMFGSPGLSVEKVAGIWNEISRVYQPQRSSCNIAD